MKYDFDKMGGRGGPFDTKYADIPEADTVYDYAIPFTIADMDFTCSEGIRKALQKVVDKNTLGYSILRHGNTKDVNDAIISWFGRRKGMKLTEDNIFITDGSLGGVKEALTAFTKPGDGVIIQKPGYGPFESYCTTSLGRVVVKNNLLCDEDGYYTIDFDDLEEKAKDPSNTALLLCSPHNPVGRVWTKEELLRMHEICQRNGVVIISDEVHSDFLSPGVEFVNLMQLVGGKGVVTCTGLGKTFNVAQLDAGIALIQDEELLPAFRQVHGSPAVNEFKMQAYIGAFTDSDDWVDQVVEYINGNFDAAIEFLAQHMPKVKVKKPEGTYILWMDFAGYNLPDEEITRRIYNNAWVILEDGTRFGDNLGARYQRMCLCAPCYRIMEALERISKEFEND